MRRRTGPWRRFGFGGVLVLVAGLPALAGPPPVEAGPRAAPATRRVLVIQSFGRDLEPLYSYAALFREKLVRASPYPIEFHDVTIATAAAMGGEGERIFTEVVRALGSRRRLDLIVTIGGPATRFMLDRRAAILPGTPLLVGGVDRRYVPPQALSPNDAYVEFRLDLRALLDNVFRLRPETNELVLVFGASPHETFWRDAVRRDFAPFADRARLTDLSGLPYGEMLSRVASLPPSAAVFFALYTEDVDGAPHVGRTALADVAAASTAPVFGVHDSDLGHGIVGGPLMPLDGFAHLAAAAAARLLEGAPPSSVRTVPLGLGVPTYDARELARWNIDAARLPPRSVVLYRTPSVWDTHREAALAALVVGLAQAGLIAALASSLRGRRHAERDLRRSREQYALAVDGANDGIWDRDFRTGRVEYSARCAEILGAATEGGIDTYDRLMERIHADDRERVGAVIDSHVTGPDPQFRVAFRLRLQDGIVRHCLARGKVLKDPDGRAHRVVGALTDITDLKAAEERVREISRRLLVAQEDERARLARDLHDDVTQRLARLAIDAGRAELEQRGAPLEETFRGLREGLVELSADVHALSYRLHPSLLEDLGLAHALQVECDQFSATSGVPSRLFLGTFPRRLPQGVEISLYRVAQEALRNVARHARARSVEVRLEPLDGGVQLSVQDDGVGFDAQAPPARHSLGQASMRERVLLVGGEIDIESERGGGTTVLAFVPLEGEPA